jgi:hypothetical protein
VSPGALAYGHPIFIRLPWDFATAAASSFLPLPIKAGQDLQMRKARKVTSVMGCELSRQLSEPAGVDAASMVGVCRPSAPFVEACQGVGSRAAHVDGSRKAVVSRKCPVVARARRRRRDRGRCGARGIGLGGEGRQNWRWR